MPSLSPARRPSRRAATIATAAAAACALALAPLTAASAAVVPDPITYSADDAALALSPLGTFETGVFDESAAEIVTAYGDRLFVVNAVAGSVSVLDYADPTATRCEFAIAAQGVANSVAVRADGLGVIAFEAPVKTDPGTLVFFDANAADAASAILGSVTRGRPARHGRRSRADGTYAVVANEGEPADDFSIDPEGSVSDRQAQPARRSRAPTQKDVRTATSTRSRRAARCPCPRTCACSARPRRATTSRSRRNLEPEYVAIDGRTAYVALQEANAIAVVDLEPRTVTEIMPARLQGPRRSTATGSTRPTATARRLDIRTFAGPATASTCPTG